MIYNFTVSAADRKSNLCPPEHVLPIAASENDVDRSRPRFFLHSRVKADYARVGPVRKFAVQT